MSTPLPASTPLLCYGFSRVSCRMAQLHWQKYCRTNRKCSAITYTTKAM